MKPEKPFRTFQQFNRCAKAWALLTVYFNADIDHKDASNAFCQASFDYVERELLRMKLPDGWNQHPNFPEFKEWFIKNT